MSFEYNQKDTSSRMNKIESPDNEDSIDIMELKSFNEVKHVDEYEDEEPYDETGKLFDLCFQYNNYIF